MGRGSKPVLVFREIDVGSLERLPTPGEISLEDAALFLEVSTETLRRYVADGRLRARKQSGTSGQRGWRWVVSTRDMNHLKRKLGRGSR